MDSDRLTLREFHLTDAAFLFELNNDAEVMKFTGDEPFKSVAEAEEFISSYADYQKYGFGRWLVEDKKTLEPYGWCGLKYHEDNDYIDLGFRLKKSAWNKGYATESGQRCIQFAKEVGLKFLVGRAMVENKASLHVLRKLGFTKWEDLTDDLHCGTIGYLEL